MANEATDVAAVTPEAKPEVKPEAAAAAEKTDTTGGEAKEPTAGEVAAGNTVPTKKESDTIPVSAFLDEKKGRKEAERVAAEANKALADLKKSIEDGATKSQVSTDIAEIAKEYDVDPIFLGKFAKAMEAKAEAAAEAKLRPIEEKDRQAKIDAAFKTAYESAMDKMPEFAKIVNPEVIKILSLDPKNGNKTFTQIIEEAYGGVVPGKRTIETTTPGGGKEPAPLDMNRARKDTAYFNEIMASPKLKEEYNAEMLRRGF